MKKKLKGDLSNVVTRGNRLKLVATVFGKRSPVAADETIKKNMGIKRGRPPSKHPRTSSHIPLRSDERAKLGKAAESQGLPYATWARMTLLLVADWPADMQPIRGFGPFMASPTIVPVFITRQTSKGEERSYDGGRTWGRNLNHVEEMARTRQLDQRGVVDEGGE